MTASVVEFKNPFRPGAGHMPPYLAGRENERAEFQKLLEQEPILQNVILTGLRGLGKTVLLETFKPKAIEAGWLWVGTDLSESTSVSEQNLTIRLLTDLSVVTSTIVTSKKEQKSVGLVHTPRIETEKLDFRALAKIYAETPGLTSDKMKAVLELAWSHLKGVGKRGIIFAYDEAQNLSDRSEKDEYPLSLLLDVFQSLQRKDIPYLLVLTGLPTLFPKLVEARTYAERMFHVIFLDKLNEQDSRAAIKVPIEKVGCPIKLSEPSIKAIHGFTRGYPYFIQYFCREVFDVWSQKVAAGEGLPPVPLTEIRRKLDSDFFAGRWARATDRQRELLAVIASLDSAATEFTVQEVAERSAKGSGKPFSPSHINQMLSSLSEAGLVYKNRWGKYSFAVPLLDDYIRRRGKEV